MSVERSALHVGRQIVMPSEPGEEPGVLITRQDFLLLCEGDDVGGNAARRDMCLGLCVACVLAAVSLVTTGQYFVDNKPDVVTWIASCFFGAGTIATGALALWAGRDAARAVGRPSYRECRDRLAATWETTARLGLPLSAAWQRVIEDVMRRKPTLGAVLTHVQLRELRDRDLNLSLAGDAVFHREMLADEANRNLVLQAIRRHIAGAERFNIS